MMPTSVLPSGVIARPSMPLLATRPDVLLLISVAPTGLRGVCRPPTARHLRRGWGKMKQRGPVLGFTCVATVITAVAVYALWGVVHDGGRAAVSWWDVAASDFLPLGAVVLF